MGWPFRVIRNLLPFMVGATSHGDAAGGFGGGALKRNDLVRSAMLAAQMGARSKIIGVKTGAGYRRDAARHLPHL